jgi:hypothetical protein
MASESAAKYTCKYGSTDKLTAKNYHSWKRDMEAFLLSEDALDIVQGKELAPAANARDPVAQATLRDFRRRSGRAFAMITTSCDESIRALIDDIPQGDSAAVWKALKEHLDTSKTRSGRIAIVRRFHRMRMSANSTVSEYISSLRETRKELVGSAEKISDETLLTHLLSTLPDSFSNIVDIITHKPIEEQTLAAVTSDLIEHEKKLQERKEELGAGTNTANTMTDANALAASVQFRNRSAYIRKKKSRSNGGLRRWRIPRLRRGNASAQRNLRANVLSQRNWRANARVQGNLYADAANVANGWYHP